MVSVLDDMFHPNGVQHSATGFEALLLSPENDFSDALGASRAVSQSAHGLQQDVQRATVSV